MEIVHIFVPESGAEEGEGLWAVEYEGEGMNEFEKLLKGWADPEYIHEFCREHLNDLWEKFGYEIDLDTAINELMDEASVFVQYLSKLATQGLAGPKLRIYAVRIDKNTYVVTGGAIKLTNRMQDRPHMYKQLHRLRTVRDWLKEQGVYYSEDLTNLL